MACSFRLLILNGLNRLGERGTAADVASLMVAVVVAHCIAQHIVKRICCYLGALSISMGDRVGVHRQFLSLCGAKADQWVAAAIVRRLGFPADVGEAIRLPHSGRSG